MTARRPTVAEAQAAGDAEIERRFLASLITYDGVRKTTTPGRLGLLDDLLIELACPSRPRMLRLMDMGVSSGVTTLEWIHRMEADSLSFELVAADAVVDATLQSAGPLRALVDTHGHVLLYEALGIGIRNDRNSVSTFRRLFHRAMFVSWQLARRIAVKQRHCLGDSHISLVVRTLRDHPFVTVTEDDLTVARPEWNAYFDIVRAANFLNRGYFDEDRLRSFLHRLFACLSDGGYLAVGRNLPSGGLEASVVRRDGNATILVARIGGGSEIEDLLIRSPRRGLVRPPPVRPC